MAIARKAWQGSIMPIYVDHDARRQEIADLACRLISEGGIESVTFRKLAAAARCSTTNITHYFPDRHHLLLGSFRASGERAKQRFSQAVEHPDSGLLGCLEALLPMTEQARRDWYVNLAFWQVASFDPALGKEQRRILRYFRGHIANVLRRSGTLTPRQVSRWARWLLTATIGIGVQALMEEAGWSPARQRALLVDQIGMLGL
jgi:AcrR family transcriptional regulator